MPRVLSFAAVAPAAFPLFRKLFFLSAAIFMAVGFAQAQTCWVYTDNTQAPAPMKCVQKTDLTQSCTCNPSSTTQSCQNDCTAIPIPVGTQTIRQLHQAWHDCFGPVGGSNPPVGRGERWYAFHRQFNFDFDIWRRPLGYAPIESLEWCKNIPEPIGTAGATYVPPPDVTADHCGQLTSNGVNFIDAPPRPAGAICTQCIAFPHCLFKAGGGPMACPSQPSSSCTGSGVSFNYTSLDQFKNVDEVAKILDSYFHADMHVATGQADRTPAQGCDLFRK
jgi:hypothetical protein